MIDILILANANVIPPEIEWIVGFLAVVGFVSIVNFLIDANKNK